MTRKKLLKKLKILTRRLKRESVQYWHFDGDDHLYIDFIQALCVAHIWKGNPVWAVILGAAGAGKTDVLMRFHGHELMHIIDKMSPNTLISGYKDQKNPDDDQSIMPLLDKHFLILKDFTTMMQSDAKSRDAVIGQLRSAYDGQCGNAYGIGGAKDGIKEHEAHFTVICACTNIYEHYYSVNQQLGERFLLFKFRHVDLKTVSRKALENQASGNYKKKELDKLYKRYLTLITKYEDLMPDLHEVKLSPKYMSEAIDIAELVARGRTHIHRDGRSREVQSEASIETPTRLVQQLSKLGRGSAVMNGRMYVNRKDMLLVARIAADTIPSARMNILRILYRHQKKRKVKYPTVEHMQAMSPTDMAKKCAVSRTQTARIMEDLQLCGVLKKHTVNHKAKYSLRAEYVKVMKTTKMWKTGKTCKRER